MENVKNGGHPPFRPCTDEEAVGEEEVIQMMKKCWAEECMERPDFHQLKSIIRRLNKWVFNFSRRWTEGIWCNGHTLCAELKLNLS